MINKYKRFTTDRILHFIYKRSKGTQETVSLTPLLIKYFGEGNQRQLLDCKLMLRQLSKEKKYIYCSEFDYEPWGATHGDRLDSFITHPVSAKLTHDGLQYWQDKSKPLRNAIIVAIIVALIGFSLWVLEQNMQRSNLLMPPIHTDTTKALKPH